MIMDKLDLKYDEFLQESIVLSRANIFTVADAYNELHKILLTYFPMLKWVTQNDDKNIINPKILEKYYKLRSKDELLRFRLETIN